MTQLWELQLMNKHQTLSPNFVVRLQIRKLNIYQRRIKVFDDAQRTTTKNALTDLYICLFGSKFVETIDTAAALQIVVTLCHTFLFKATKQPPKMRSKQIP